MKSYRELLEAVHNYKKTDEAFAFQHAVDRNDKAPEGKSTNDAGQTTTTSRKGGVTYMKIGAHKGVGASYHTSGHIDGKPFHHASFSRSPEKTTRNVAATNDHLGPEHHKKILAMHNAHHFGS